MNQTETLMMPTIEMELPMQRLEEIFSDSEVKKEWHDLEKVSKFNFYTSSKENLKLAILAEAIKVSVIEGVTLTKALQVKIKEAAKMMS